MIQRIIYISLIFISCSIHCFAQAPNVTYLTSDTLAVGVEMAALKPTSAADKAITYIINPKLPDGFKFDTVGGVISGKPAGVSNGDYHVTAIKDKKPGLPFTLKIVVCQAPCDACSTPDKTKSKASCCTTLSKHCLTCGEWWLVFTPVILFTIFIIIFLLYMNSKSGEVFSLKQALSESTYPQIIEPNINYKALTITQLIDLQKACVAPTAAPSTTNFFPTTITVTDKKYRASMSRLIAFLTSLVSMVIGLGLSCFFIYWYLKTGCVPEVGKLTDVLLAMGIGVVPYAANKLSNVGSGGSGK